MSSCSYASRIECKTAYLQPAADSRANVEAAGATYARDLFTQQTGQILLEIGVLFINIPPFNEHVDRNTGELLISIGNKLRSRK